MIIQNGPLFHPHPHILAARRRSALATANWELRSPNERLVALSGWGYRSIRSCCA